MLRMAIRYDSCQPCTFSIYSSLVQFTISSATIPQLSPSCLSPINSTVLQVTATCHQMVHITDVVTDRSGVKAYRMTSQVATLHSSLSLLPCQMSCSDVTPSNTCTACATNSTVFCLVLSSDIIHLTANCTTDHPWTTSANKHICVNQKTRATHYYYFTLSLVTVDRF